MSRIRMSYVSYINSRLWKDRVREYFKTHPRRCAICSTTDREIHLHHLTYENMGREPDEDLMALCKDHHQLVHAVHRQHGGEIGAATVYVKKLFDGVQASLPKQSRAERRVDPQARRKMLARAMSQQKSFIQRDTTKLRERDEQYARQLAGRNSYEGSGGRW